MLRQVRRLQQEVVQAECHVERRIAEPRALRIDEHRPVRSDENVLRADVAVHEHAPRRGRASDQREEHVGELRMDARALDEIGLQPDRVEVVVGGEAMSEVRTVGRCGMDSAEHVADVIRYPRIDVASEQLRLPVAKLRPEELHDEALRRIVLSNHARHGAGHNPADRAQVVDLRKHALDRDPPLLRDLEPGQRLLDAIRPRAQIDPEDARRDAASQRQRLHVFMLLCQAQRHKDASHDGRVAGEVDVRHDVILSSMPESGMTNPRLQVAVMGAGAVGCYFGGMLARAGHDVTLIARPQHVEAIIRDGLHMDTRTFDEHVRVKASQ